MMRLYAIAGGACILLGLWGLINWQAAQISRQKADLIELEALLKAAEDTVRIEHRTQTIIREIHTRSAEAQTDVQLAADPECANPEPVLGAWRTGIERLRDAADAGERAAGGD
ncbi:MAG: hypothetical protein QM645_07175 [Asticcacaulis sp.]